MTDRKIEHIIFKFLIRITFHSSETTDSWLGRVLRAIMSLETSKVIDTREAETNRANVRRMAQITAAKDPEHPILAGDYLYYLSIADS